MGGMSTDDAIVAGLLKLTRQGVWEGGRWMWEEEAGGKGA